MTKKMTNICMLLNGPIQNDHRVIKIINTLSKNSEVDLYYIKGNISDKDLFKNNSNLFSINIDNNFSRKIIKHTLFCFEFNLFIKSVLSKGKSYDYIWANDLPTLYPAFKIAKKLDSKLVYDSHEIYSETLNQFFPEKTTLLKSKIFYLLIKFMKIHGKFIEKRIFKKLHCFITVNKSLLNYFDKIYHIPNSLIIMNFPYLKSQTKIEKIDFRKKYNWEGKSVIFIYQGVLNYGRGIKLFIKSLSITNNRYKLVILGDGPIKNEISTLINELNLENRVKTIPMVSLNKYLNYTSAADFGLNLLEPINKSKEFASPNKLFEYIHIDKPVLCSNTYENKLVIEKYNVGLMTENSMEEISKNIVKLSQDNNIVKKEFNLAKNEFNWERQEKKLLEIIL